MDSTAVKGTDRPKLTLHEKFSYAMGDVGNNFLFDLGQIYLLKFYTDVLGLPSASAGLIFLVTKIFDAFADISVGTWIDSRRNVGPRGKFRPFMLYGILPLGLLTVASFTTPDFSVSGKLIFAYLTYMAFGFVYSVVNIPYGSMAAAMTQDPVERAELAAFRQAGSNMGLLITTVGFMPIVLMSSNASTGYLMATSFFAVLGVLFTLYCYANIKERIVVERPKESKASLGKSFKSLLKNAPLLLLCLVNLFTFSAFNVKLAVQVYYCQYVLNNVGIVPYMGFFSIGCVFIGVACVPTVVRKLGKKNTYMLGCAIWAVGDILNYLTASSSAMFIGFACVAFFGTSFVNSLNWALIADAVEYGEWKTGERSEGIVYSSFTFFRKLSQAIAGFVPGVVLAWIGYVPNAVQNASTLAGIKGLIFIYPAVLAMLTIVVLGVFYKLDDKRYAEILAELTARKQKAVG